MNIDRLTCEELFRKLDDYLDHELSADETRLVREHLDVCAVCAGEYAFEQSVIENVREKIRRVAAPPDLLARVTRALQQAREDDRSS